MDRTKNPSSILYWNDLENDAQLKTCSLAAKGLWDHHMLPIAARSAEPGVILLGNHPSRLDGDLPALLARAVGELPETITILLRELVDSGAASVDAAGRLYNRRMVREEGIRKARAEAGRKGGTAPKTKKANPEQTPNPGGSNAGSKIGGGPSTVSVGKITAIPPKSTTDGKQTPKPTGSKNEPSSSFSLQSSSDVTTIPSSEAASSPTAAREAPAADGPQAALITHEMENAAFAGWQAVAATYGWPDASILTSTRRYKLQIVLAACGGLEGWKAALVTAATTAKFLQTTDGHWQRWFNIDWLLNIDNFTKLMEGRYAERHHDEKPDERSLTAGLAGLAQGGAR